MAAERTITDFLERLRDSGVLPEAAVSKVNERASDYGADADAKPLATELARDSTLTLFQANVIYKGLPVGLSLGNYVVLEKIGEGGMGTVYKAKHRRMNRVVALKVLSTEAMKSAGAIARFHREVEAAARLNHLNIVSAYDADETNGVHYLVMEYIDGGDLDERVVKDGPLTPELACDVLTQSAEGLAYAHAQGVIHRDIKPSNILLDSKGVARILDMGLASQVATPGLAEEDSSMTRLTQAGSLLGTVDFMSPEQAVDAREIDHTSDIYSLGCTFYFLLTGTTLYQGATPMERLFAHRESPVPALADTIEGLPQQYDIVLRRMVAKKPADRFQSAQELLDALNAWDELSEADGSATGSTKSRKRPDDKPSDDELPDDVLSQIFDD